MRISTLVTVVLLSAVVASAPVFGQQPSGSQPGHGDMGSMPMDMMKQCHEQHHAMTKSVDQLSNTLADAKQSNDPAKMRDAIDRAQKQLADMKQNMNACNAMMQDMEKMHGGMMK